jgi:hypothetical protein
LTAISMVLFGVALSQPAFFWGSDSSSSGPAGRLLLEGWKGLASGYFEWLANPALLLCWILTLRGNRPPAVASAVLALGLMLVFLCRQTLRLPGGQPGATIVAYGAGYWLWLGSALLMVVAAARRTSR